MDAGSMDRLDRELAANVIVLDGQGIAGGMALGTLDCVLTDFEMLFEAGLRPEFDESNGGEREKDQPGAVRSQGLDAFAIVRFGAVRPVPAGLTRQSEAAV